MVEIRYDGAVYDCAPSETVLEALLRQGAEVPFSCRKGVCLTCMLRAVDGRLPADAQEGLKDTLRLQAYFLSCVYKPGGDLEIAPPEDAALFGRATVVAVERCASSICRVFLEPATPLFYHAGQFINLRRSDGLMRSYSLASVPQLDSRLELHVKRLHGGRISSWIFERLEPGERVDFQGPNGNCFYVPRQPGQPLLLIGNGSGLAPLIGIARDALHDGHKGPIRLYHGSRRPGGLYLGDTLREMAARHSNFTYFPCVSGERVPSACRAGRAEETAFADHPDLTGWRIFLCGYPPMVHAARKTAFLSGASLDDIYADAFELQDLRGVPRD